MRLSSYYPKISIYETDAYEAVGNKVNSCHPILEKEIRHRLHVLQDGEIICDVNVVGPWPEHNVDIRSRILKTVPYALLENARLKNLNLWYKARINLSYNYFTIEQGFFSDVLYKYGALT